MSDKITSLLSYVESATLAPIKPGLHTRTAFLAKIGECGRYLGEPGKEGAAAVGGTLVSVFANLTEQNRTDLAISLEFASRVAAKVAETDGHTPKYWEEFKKTLCQIGWSKQKDENHPLYSEAEKSVVVRSMESLRSQAEKRAFFRMFTAGGSKGSFGVGVATVDNGALTLRFSAFTFDCNTAVDDYLISSIKNIKADVGKDDVDVTGDQETLDWLRSKIQDKLSLTSCDYVDNVEI
ncbi:32 kDa-cell wall symbiosis regulated acidic polypeptide [Pisolithus marmoratus]|nr:32 kDa-cell wall symbiosis regulated acidic polypeptide [Pisolithus marmoratus]